MARVVRGPRDDSVEALHGALEDYERQFPGSEASLYRQNPGAVRIRIRDDRFAGMSRSRRHDEVWQFLSQRVGDDTMSEISTLILLPTSELRTSLANQEFEDPLPSHL